MEPQFFPESIESERVLLAKHNLSIAQTMFDFVDRDRARLREFLPWVDSTLTVQDEINYIQMTHDKWNKHELFDFGIFRKQDQQYLGNIGVHTIEWNLNRCELGYWILGDFEGRGFVSEAVMALEKVCFQLGFHRIEIRCSTRNLRSSHVPIRCGYELEGTLREDSIEQGNYRSTLVFGKLATDK